MKLKKTLTDTQRSRFVACKKVVKDGLQTCFQVGAALIEIRDEKLYIEDFDTFEEFSQEVFGMERSRTYQLIDAAEVKKSVSMSTIGGQITNERQARALGKVPEKDRIKTLKAVAAKGPVTAKNIENYEPTEPPGVSEPVIVRDETGVPIPPKPLEFWNRRQEVKDMMNAISKLKCQIEKAMAEGDPIWINVSQHIVSQMEICYSYIKDAMPHSLCTVCNGWPEQTKCDYCNGMGILSKRRYMGTDDRIRSIREKAHAQFLTA